MLDFSSATSYIPRTYQNSLARSSARTERIVIIFYAAKSLATTPPRDWPLPFRIVNGFRHDAMSREEISALWLHRDGHFLLRIKTQPLQKKAWLLIRNETRDIMLDITCNANKIAPPLRDINKFLNNDHSHRKKISRRAAKNA